MSKNILILAVAVSFFAGSMLAKTPEPANSAPLGAEIEKFPFFKQGELTVSYAEPVLELRAEKLKKPTLVYNHFRGDGSWRLQTLPIGDEVWVEKATGIPRYRVACSNRIVRVGLCGGERVSSTFNPLTGHPTGSSVTGGNSNPSSTERFLKALATGWDKFMDGLGTTLGWLLPLLLLLLLLGLAGYGLYRLFQRRQDDPPPAPPVVAPTPTPVTPRPAVVPAQEFVQSRPAPTTWLSPEGEIVEDGDDKKSQPRPTRSSFAMVPAKGSFSAKPEGEKPEVATGEFKILKGGKGKPTAYIISGCIVGFEKRADGSFLIREAE